MLKQGSVLHEITRLKPGAKKTPFDPIFTQTVSLGEHPMRRK
jgi:hypothetical protein